MPKKQSFNTNLPILHSDKLVMEILGESNKFLDINTETTQRINKCYWVFHSLFELIPETVENFWSGHIFPITEAQYELECSIVFCKLGFYKHAIASLRNVLELGLLSVYWDIDGKVHIDIQNWLKSMESTPFRKEVFLKLKTNSNIKDYDSRQNIFEKTKALYSKLSNFSHTKGFGYSSRKLNKHTSNVNSFNELSFNKWFNLMEKVVGIVTTFHVLKYPIGLQNTPIEDKFGLNGPMGGFLRPNQVTNIKTLIPREMLADLQEISDNDPEAQSIAEWVNSQSNITEEEFALQIEKNDKSSIKWEGFEHWFKNQKKLSKYFEKKQPEVFKKN